MERFRLAILVITALCITAGTRIVPRDGPALTDFDSCRAGTIKGGGLDDISGLYAWTCGNYNWSAEVGGVDANGVIDYNTPTTAGGNSWIMDCTGAGTATGAPFEQEVCLEDGEQIHMYIMADFDLAVDNTVPGGTIYFPAAIYHDALCGQQSDGSPNGCPVLQHFPENQVSKMFFWGNRKVVGAGIDGDGPLSSMLEGTRHRESTWIVSDHGTPDVTTCGAGNDEACDLDRNGTNTVAPGHWTFRMGLGNPVEPRVCYLDLGDTGCDTGTAFATGVGGVTPWGRFTAILQTSEHNTASARICLDNTLSTTGTCSGDRRVICTNNSARTSITEGGCDFSGSGGDDLGTCEGFTTALATDLSTAIGPIKLVITTDMINGPYDDTITVSTGSNAVYAQASAVVAGTCGTFGQKVEFEKWEDFQEYWPLSSVYFDPADHSVERVAVIDDRIQMQGGGFSGMNFMPASWIGRDDNGSGTNDEPQDCLTAASAESCDEKETWALGSSIGGTAENNSIWLAGGGFGFAVVDGSTAGFMIRVKSNLWRNGRGLLIDAADFTFQQNWVDEWDAETNTLYNVTFNHGGGIIEDQIHNSTGDSAFRARGGLGGVIRDVRVMSSEFSFGIVRLVGPSIGTLYDNITVMGYRGPLVTVSPVNLRSVTDVRFTNWHVRGWNPSAASGNRALAAIILADFDGDASSLTGSVKNLRFDNWDIGFHGDLDACMIHLEGGTGDDSDAANGLGRAVDEWRSELSLNNIRMENTAAGATGTQFVFCLGNQIAAENEADERIADIWAGVGGWPRWSGLTLNGVNFPDNPYVSQTAASVDDCDTLSFGATVRIYDDATAAQTCADADADGVLDGGGTFNSLCVCDPTGDSGDGAWASIGLGGGVHPIAAGDYAAGSIDADDVATSLDTKVACIYIKAPATDEQFESVWRAPVALTITEIWCEVDAGTVLLDLNNDDGTPTGINGSDITCPVPDGISDVSFAGDAVFAQGDRVDVDLGTVTTATKVSICWRYVVS